MTYFVACLIATLVVALALNRSQQDARSLSWRMLLAPETRAALRQLEEHCQLEDAMLMVNFGAAERMRMDRRAQAERVLRAVLVFVEESQPERLARLRALRAFARMTAAVMVAPAISPRNFRLPELWTVAGVGALAHFVLVSPAERLVLRLYVLSLGFRLTLRSMRRAAVRPRWGHFERALADWCQLDVAHVQASRDAVMALPSEGAVPVATGR